MSISLKSYDMPTIGMAAILDFTIYSPLQSSSVFLNENKKLFISHDQNMLLLV